MKRNFKEVFAKKLVRLLVFLIVCSVGISAISIEGVSAYTTAGSYGRSQGVVSGFYVNTSWLAPLGSACRSGQALVGFAGVTIHETSNWSSGASARMHALYLRDKGQNSEVSWHYSVDSTSAYQSIPETEKAWHAGDTENGVGNARTIAIEICDNSDGNFDQAMANAEWLAADILFRHNIHLVSGALFQHHDFSAYGKNCPITIRDTGRWSEFCAKTQVYLNQMVEASNPGIETTSISSNEITSTYVPTKMGYMFGGWYKDAACSTTWVYGVDASSSGIVVYAKWLRQSVFYQSSIQDIGWQGSVRNGTTSGTSGQSKRLEAIAINLENISGGIEYRAHVQDFGWMDWVSSGTVSGTTGQSKRLEAIEIRLTGAAADQFDIYYRVHAENYGWLDWAQNGQSAGTAGYSYRVEAIQIQLVTKGGSAPGSTTRHFVDPSTPFVMYQSSLQDIGWQNTVSNGTVSGTTGQSRRLEAIAMTLGNIDGGIEYRGHVQDIGWMNWVGNGAVSGTIGQSKRLEAVEIRLTGAAADLYDIYYRVHAETYGWMGWAQNGQSAGTAGYSYRVEAIQIQLVPKGGAAPGTTVRHFVDSSAPSVVYQSSLQNIGWQGTVSDGSISGTTGQSRRLEAISISLVNSNGEIEYRAHVQDIGWMDWTGNGGVSGTIGQSKRLEAVEIRLTGEMADQYDIYYRVHSENCGWLDWAQNGQSAGTAGYSYRVEAVQIILVAKGGAAPGLTANPFIQRT